MSLLYPCLCSIVDESSARDRFVRVVQWYLSVFHAGRRSGVAKKPYNPVLGEIFRCYYDLPDDDDDDDDDCQDKVCVYKL